MKNDYIKNYVYNSLIKGECEIIDDKWQCQTINLFYTGSREYGRINSSSLVKFNLKENKLIIPAYYYYYLIIGLHYVPGKEGNFNNGPIPHKQECYLFPGEINYIYCTCPKGKDSFGVISLFFKDFSRLDIDLRDYVYYDKSGFVYKCRINVILSKENEFIIGLKGLNNTIFNFNLDDKKIEFFHRKKDDNSVGLFIIIWVFAIIAFLFYLIYKCGWIVID